MFQFQVHGVPCRWHVEWLRNLVAIDECFRRTPVIEDLLGGFSGSERWRMERPQSSALLGIDDPLSGFSG